MTTFADIKAILDGIDSAADVPASGAPHQVFWNITREQFLAQEVPNLKWRSVIFHIKSVDTGTPLASAFYKILLGPLVITEGTKSVTLPQMPKGGPFITDPAYSATVNGGAMTGAQIKAAIEEWLTNGMP
jgi:hypothetical protein